MISRGLLIFCRYRVEIPQNEFDISFLVGYVNLTFLGLPHQEFDVLLISIWRQVDVWCLFDVLSCWCFGLMFGKQQLDVKLDVKFVVLFDVLLTSNLLFIRHQQDTKQNFKFDIYLMFYLLSCWCFKTSNRQQIRCQ